MSKPMEIVEERAGDVTILRLKGRLELDDGDLVLRRAVDDLVSGGRVNVVLDMA